MFSSAEFLEKWNQIFSFKIKESDLAKPTETFVFNALINYLKVFNFDTAPMIALKYSENVAERRAFLVRFCYYIDHIYKISDKSHSFLFYDLKQPSPKKTVHMLNHLLNYYFYYNMFKESILPVANAKIEQRQNLIDSINKHKFEISQLEVKAKNIEKKLKKYRPLAPKTKAQLEALTAEERYQKDDINQLQEQLVECNKLLETLRAQEARVTLRIVSKDEVNRLRATKQSLEEAIADRESLENTTYANIRKRTDTLNELQKVMSSIDNAEALNSPSSLQSHNDYAMKVTELESKLAATDQRRDTIKEILEKREEEVQKLQEVQTSKTNQLIEMQTSGKKDIEDLKKLTQSKEATISDLEHELEHTEEQIAEEKKITSYILEKTSSLVRANITDSDES